MATRRGFWLRRADCWGRSNRARENAEECIVSQNGAREFTNFSGAISYYLLLFLTFRQPRPDKRQSGQVAPGQSAAAQHRPYVDESANA